VSVVGATLYVLFRDGIQIASGSSLSIVDTGLAEGTKYSYNVKSI